MASKTLPKHFTTLCSLLLFWVYWSGHPYFRFHDVSWKQRSWFFAPNWLATSDPVCRCAYRCAFPTAYMFAGSFPHFVEVDEVCVVEGFSYHVRVELWGQQMKRLFFEYFCMWMILFVHKNPINYIYIYYIYIYYLISTKQWVWPP